MNKPQASLIDDPQRGVSPLESKISKSITASADEDVEKRELSCTVAATVESSMENPYNIKNASPLWPTDSTAGNLSAETQNSNSKEYMHPYVHCNIIYNSPDTEVTQVPVNRLVDKKSGGTCMQWNVTLP